MEQWKEYKIGDVCDSISETFRGTAEEVVLINTSDVLEGKCLNHTKTENKNLKGQFKKTFRKDDILYSEIRPANKRFAYIDFEPVDYIASTKLMVLRHNEKINPHYLFYILKSNAVIEQLQMLAESRSGTFPQITFSELANLPILLPNLSEQNKILSVLEALDNKIELNRRINDNLERQAQALFKSWFVDNINEDWSKCQLSEIADFFGGYSYKGCELIEDSQIAMATIKNFDRSGGFKIDGYKPISPSAKLKESQTASLFDILVAHTDLTQNAEVIGNAEQIMTTGSFEKIIYSMDLVKVVPKAIFPFKYLLCALLKNNYFKSHCLGYVNGTTVLHLSKRALPDYSIYLPDNDTAKTFDAIFESIYKQIAQNIAEIESLTNVRDCLLPRLMSGELKINDLNC